MSLVLKPLDHLPDDDVDRHENTETKHQQNSHGRQEIALQQSTLNQGELGQVLTELLMHIQVRGLDDFLEKRIDLTAGPVKILFGPHIIQAHGVKHLHMVQERIHIGHVA